ncbi:MAG TPA: efflux RND transporter periplasmic adaptor subunit [Bryobacteraceae bacterium]|nr:efflux RND transporter periplasmic adaptor subunit [Bryobacteraceae bacterium]
MTIPAQWRAGAMAAGLAILSAAVTACGNHSVQAEANPGVKTGAVEVGVAAVKSMPLSRSLTISSELVPFQEIDVYAKESGYVKQLLVDYGTRVKAGQLMAVLEIPELEQQLQQDDAAIRSAADQVTHSEHEVSRYQAQQNVLHLQADRLSTVAKNQPGLVAQQEVDDARGKDLAAAAQVESAQSNLAVAQSLLDGAKAKRQRDQVLFDYSKITAPFAGTVTQRFANLGTLVQAGTNSSTQALPLARLSEDDKFRLVIPVPESYVRYIKVGDPAQVSVPALGRTYSGTVARFSVDVKEDTRTMHTEVDILNTDRKLLPGLYAEATLSLDRKNNAIAVPVQALSQTGDQATVYVVSPSGVIEVRNINLGIQTPKEAEVLAGLKEGELVVVSDRSSLKAGQQVHEKEVPLLQAQE